VGDQVIGFSEKPRGDGGLINGGYFVLSPKCLDLIEGDAMPWESVPMNALASQNQLMAYEHRGFWQPMDTLREKLLLQSYWDSGNPPWKKWD
jgi:glucose-1-phosphate cytidylyltransferase